MPHPGQARLIEANHIQLLFIDAMVVILYTHCMQKMRSRQVDWLSIGLLILLFEIAATRLIVTRWTELLVLGQSLATFGLVLGLALGYSRFGRKTVLWLTAGYTFMLVPWQWTLAIRGDVQLSEKLASVAGRLLYSLGQFFRREVVEDGFLFVAFITLVLWCISLVSGYYWARRRNFLAAVLPAGLFILIIQLYDSYNNSRILLVGIYLLMALFLLGRVYYLQNRDSWQTRRVFQVQESTYDLTRGLVITATLFVLIAWTVPASAAGWQSAVQTWSRFTEPWRDTQEWFSNAVEVLESQGGRRTGEIYGDKLTLGIGNPLTDTVLFTVKDPLTRDESPPRYYWRGYVYDQYTHNQWSSSFTNTENYEPTEELLQIPDTEGRTTARFTVSIQVGKSSGLYQILPIGIW